MQKGGENHFGVSRTLVTPWFPGFSLSGDRRSHLEILVQWKFVCLGKATGKGNPLPLPSPACS